MPRFALPTRAADTAHRSTTSLATVQGLDDEDDGPEFSGPRPHPDDRLWRHPSEIAAMHAAAASATAEPTVELPAVTVGRSPVGLLLNRGLMTAAVVVAIGATALAVGALTARSSTDQASTIRPAALTSLGADTGNTDGIVLDTELDPEQALADRLHAELGDALPRVQAATATGMLEGSGAFITADGHLVTSSRLVTGADYLLVWTADGSRWAAELVASDRFSDVAVLRVEPEAVDQGSFGAASFKPGAELRTGQYAITLDHDVGSMTFGQVSSLVGAAPDGASGDRSSRFDVQPGMTPGAAIVDDSGAIIGLVNAASGSQATPSWMVERVAADLLSNGATRHAWLGVHVESDLSRGSARVLEVVTGSPAANAGLRPGDLIDAVGSDALSTTASLWTLIQRRSPGDTIDLTVTRNGERRIVSAQLSALPD